MSVYPQKSKSWATNVAHLVRHSLKVDFSSKDRLITPIFYAAIILILFSFAIPEQDPTLRTRMMVAQSQLAIFFALQVTFSRAFDSERLDRVFDHIRLSPIPSSSFIIAKILHVLLVGGGTMLFTGLLSVLLQGQELSLVFDPVVIGASVLALLGLTALGVLLATVTLHAQGHQIIFPLLYFPLSIPILLCSCEALAQWLSSHRWDDSMRGWTTMLVSFDIIYLTLTILLGADSLNSN